jgi:uncharacterized surface protein with fasciclin (FAS1) repeats
MIRTFRILSAAIFVVFAQSAAARADSVLETLRNAGNFSIFLAAAKNADMNEMLSTRDPITVFAPSDDAFSKLSKKTVDMLIKPEGKEGAKTLVSNHVIAGVILASDVSGKRLEATTIAGTNLLIDDTRAFMIAGGKVTKADIVADNGLVHVVDTVLTPEESAQ